MHDEISFSDFHDRVTSAAQKHRGTVERLANGGTIVVLGDRALPSICLLSGLHGDERSGPIALLQLMERASLTLPRDYNLVIVPLVNDLGWDQRRREWKKLDLNRAIGLEIAPVFLREIAARLESMRPPGFIDLHEDSEVAYAYLYRFVRDDERFARALEQVLDARDEPWDQDPSWIGASECHVREHGARLAVTLEAPPSWPLEKRVEWQTRAIDFSIEHLPGYLAMLPGSES